jgi:hypothetical protein
MAKIFPVRMELPSDYLIGIGAVCFEWAILERGLSQITYGLLNIGQKHGRVAVRSPRASDQIAMIRQLMHLENVTSEAVDLDKLAETLGKLEKLRDMIAHGTWMRGEKDEFLLQDLGGNWKPDPHGKKVARRITPEGVMVESDSLLELGKAIKSARGAVDQLARELGGKLIPLRRKSQQQSPQGNPLNDSNSGKT